MRSNDLPGSNMSKKRIWFWSITAVGCALSVPIKMWSNAHPDVVWAHNVGMIVALVSIAVAWVVANRIIKSPPHR